MVTFPSQDPYSQAPGIRMQTSWGGSLFSLPHVTTSLSSKPDGGQKSKVLTTTPHFTGLFAREGAQSILERKPVHAGGGHPSPSSSSLRGSGLLSMPTATGLCLRSRSSLLSSLCCVDDRPEVLGINVPLMTDRSRYINTPIPSPLEEILRQMVCWLPGFFSGIQLQLPLVGTYLISSLLSTSFPSWL